MQPPLHHPPVLHPPVLATDLDGTLIPLDQPLAEPGVPAASLTNQAASLTNQAASSQPIKRQQPSAHQVSRGGTPNRDGPSAMGHGDVGNGAGGLGDRGHDDREHGGQPASTDRDIMSDQAQEEQQRSLAILRQAAIAQCLEIVFVTGRHFESVQQVMKAKTLPEPAWILCDVGTSLFARAANSMYQSIDAYVNHLDTLVQGRTAQTLRQWLRPDHDRVWQEPEKQRRHKLSFYCDTQRLERHVADLQSQLQRQKLPYQVLASIDPFTGDGLLDVLPRGVNKASGLRWWAQFQQRELDQIVYAGDSGNDLAALTDHFRAILVGNADRQLARQIHEHHAQQGSLSRLYLARGHATQGVLEGCLFFGLIKSEAEAIHPA